MRSAREYDSVPPPGVLRVAAFGDSFVYANEVPNSDAWSTVAEADFPGLEILNYGVGGYGTDQAFLLFLREGQRFAPSVVLIGFATIDMARTVNVYRRFTSTSELALVKPRFRLDSDGKLVLIPNPLPEREDWNELLDEPRRAVALGQNDAWFDPLIYRNVLYDKSSTVRLATAVMTHFWRQYLWPDRLYEGGQFRTASSAFRLQLAILRAFADSVRARGAKPALLLFPDKQSVMGRAEAPIYQPLKDSLVADGELVLDLVDAFRESSPETDPEVWFAPGGHYSREGNDLVAKWLGPQLVTLGP
jgi:hypothetical protein